MDGYWQSAMNTAGTYLEVISNRASNRSQRLDREIREEASATCQNVNPFAILGSPVSEGPVMLFFAGDDYALHDFVPGRDCFERAELNPEVLIERYHGNAELLHFLIQAAARTVRCESARMYTIPSS